MKTIQKIKLVTLIIGTFGFTYLFWKQGIGLNFGVFNLFVSACIIGFYKDFWKSKPVLLTFIGTFLASIMIVIHGSVLALVMYLISIILMIGFLHQPNLRLTFFAIFSSVNNYFNFFSGIKSEMQTEKVGTTKRINYSKFGRFLKTAIIPVIVLIIFYIIFKKANPVFNKLTTDFFSGIVDFFREIFVNISFAKIFFTIWGFTIISWIIFNSKNALIQKFDEKFKDTIFRKRAEKQKSIYSKEQSNIYIEQNHKFKLSLKNEYRTAVMLVILINTLLLIINIIDINWIWFGFEYSENFNLTQFVHEGTYLLILSILLSMGIMIYFFRKNINFYPKSNLLKISSYVWIFQNAILTVSVMLRNYHYINHFDLAYKRIGLIIFLILVLFGLFTLFLKIKNKKSGFYLFRVNTWAVYIVLIIITFVNWDAYIAKYNLSSKNTDNLDVFFLMNLNDNTLPILDKNSSLIFKAPDYYYQNTFYTRVKQFNTKFNENTWQSWNYDDYKTFKYFQGNVHFSK